MFKYIFLILTLLSFSNADYLYGKNDKCVNDFYFESGTFYYHYSKDDNYTWHSTTSNNYYKYLYPGFIYDSDNDICRIANPALSLGLTGDNYEFLMSFTGLLMGSFLSFSFFYFVRN